MEIKIKIESNLVEAGNFLTKMEKSFLVKSVKKSLLRGLASLQTEYSRAVRKRRPLRMKDIKKGWFKTKKSFKSADIRNYYTMLWVMRRPIPIISLVRGSKRPREQKGIEIKKRKPVRAMLKPGKSQIIKGGFIAKGPKSKGQFNVFRRETTNKGPMVKQSLESIHLYYMLDGFRKPIEEIVGKRMQKEFLTAYKYFVNKEMNKGSIGHPVPMIRG